MPEMRWCMENIITTATATMSLKFIQHYHVWFILAWHIFF
jgi:hypothetical protein